MCHAHCLLAFLRSNTLCISRFYELSTHPVLRCDAGRKDAEDAGAKQLQCTCANKNIAVNATCASYTVSARHSDVSRAAKGIVK